MVKYKITYTDERVKKNTGVLPEKSCCMTFINNGTTNCVILNSMPLSPGEEIILKNEPDEEITQIMQVVFDDTNAVGNDVIVIRKHAHGI